MPSYDPRKDYVRFVADALAEKQMAQSRLDGVKAAIARGKAEAARIAGGDRVGHARGCAAVDVQWATQLGEAEAAVERASLAHARAVVETAAAAKVAEHRIKAAQQLAVDLQTGPAETMMAGVPERYLRRRVKMYDFQYDALTDEGKAAAARDGVEIIQFADPEFTVADVRSVFRSNGFDQRIVTRRELDALSPSEAAAAAREAFLWDESAGDIAAADEAAAQAQAERDATPEGQAAKAEAEGRARRGEVTRDEFESMSPADQAKAARTAVLVD